MNKEFPAIFPVTCHTKHVGPGSTFVALQGEKMHGQIFIEEAIAHGATKIIIDQTYSASKIPNITYQLVDDAHQALAHYSAEALDFPAQKLSIIGVTGTKGKTTTASLLFHFLESAGIKTGLISSAENRLSTFFHQKSQLTTPTADYIQMFFSMAVNQGITHIIIETSSHALFYDKLYGVPLDMILFTNFKQDHLDFHKTMDRYFLTKLKIFSLLKQGGTVCLNNDDESIEKILNYLITARPDALIKTIGKTETASLKYKIIQNTFKKTCLRINKTLFSSQLLSGYFNAENIALAIAAVQTFHINNKSIKKALTHFKGVAGRGETIKLADEKKIIIDFAHNPSSMEAILSSLAQETEQLIVIFGCGGNKDTLKRPLMGALAAQYGSHIIITNDNPRNEDPLQIIHDILQGISNEKQKLCIIEPDRKKAIMLGLTLLKKNGIIALLGRGDEAEQIIGSTRIPFHDLSIALELSQLT